MALKGLVNKLSEKLADTFSAKSDRGPWQPAQGPFPRLLHLEPVMLEPLKEVGGVFALWHRGVRPQWIYVGHTDDLSAAIRAAQEDPDVALYDLNDGVFVAWTPCPPESRAAAVLYLRGALVPALTETALNELGPIPDGAKPVEFPLPVD